MPILLIVGSALAGIGGWDLLQWFKPAKEPQSNGESFFTLERVIALVGIGIMVIFGFKMMKRR